MERRVLGEWLDSLPPDSPDAARSRRDLYRLNRIMRNSSWFAREIPRSRRPGEGAIEVGAGDGVLARRVGADALDRVPAPVGWPASAGWHQVDLLRFDRWAEYPVVFGNFILHHFDDATLEALGGRLRRHARVLMFNEPLRTPKILRVWIVASWLIGAGRVTRHDGKASITAGFVPGELGRLLGLDEGCWTLHEGTSLAGSCRLLAVRR